MGAIRVAAAACALAWLAAVAAADAWTVHADAGTPVLHAALDAQAPAAFGAGRATRGFHESVFVHAALEDFPEVGVPVSVRARSVGRSAVDGFHVVELFGGMVKVGEYYAKIKLGGQMVRTQIDTGSATLAAPMAGCKSCLAGDRRYDLKKSAGGKGAAVACGDGDLCMENKCSPFSCGKCSDAKACCSKTEPDMCGFHLSFGDGSGAQGMLVKDDMEWGGVTFPVVFGGINKDSPDFERQEVDGILGMAYPTLACNPSCVKPTFESMVDHLKMKSVFQVCITSDAGRIVLGDWDKSLMQKEPVWVDMHLSSPPTYYTVQLSGDLMVNDRPVEFPKYKLAIADSGTTLIVFTRRSFELLVDHLQQHYCDVPGLCGANTWFRPAHCTKISEADRRKLPTLRFALVGGFVIELTSDDYLINYESKGPDFWCVGLMALDALSGGIDVIFGNTVMKKYVTIYDRENKRLGFGLSNGDCKSSVGISSDEGESAGDEVPVAEPVSLEPAAATTATPVGAPPDHAQAPAHVPVPNQDAGTHATPKNGVFGKEPKCTSATSCATCASLGDGHCFWNSALSQCLVGDPTALMCTLDTLEGNVAFLVAAAVAGCILLIACVACGVCMYKKRQSAAHDGSVDVDEAFESRVPLAPDGDGRSRSFLRRGDDDEMETF